METLKTLLASGIVKGWLLLEKIYYCVRGEKRKC